MSSFIKSQNSSGCMTVDTADNTVQHSNRYTPSKKKKAIKAAIPFRRRVNSDISSTFRFSKQRKNGRSSMGGAVTDDELSQTSQTSSSSRGGGGGGGMGAGFKFKQKMMQLQMMNHAKRSASIDGEPVSPSSIVNSNPAFLREMMKKNLKLHHLSNHHNPTEQRSDNLDGTIMTRGLEGLEGGEDLKSPGTWTNYVLCGINDTFDRDNTTASCSDDSEYDGQVGGTRNDNKGEILSDPLLECDSFEVVSTLTATTANTAHAVALSGSRQVIDINQKSQAAQKTMIRSKQKTKPTTSATTTSSTKKAIFDLSKPHAFSASPSPKSRFPPLSPAKLKTRKKSTGKSGGDGGGNSSGTAGLDIVMELKNDEMQGGVSNSAKKSVKFRRSSRGKSPSPSAKSSSQTPPAERRGLGGLRSVPSGTSSIFDFSNVGGSTSGLGGSGMVMGGIKSFKKMKDAFRGPKPGTFANVIPVQDKEESDYHKEIMGTYSSHRISTGDIAKSILKELKYSMPLYHTCTSNNSLKKQPKHLCSEPVSTGFKVRGPNYQKDKVKVPSEESVFALLGIDSTMKKKHEETRRNTAVEAGGFVNKFQAACRKYGVKTPFVLLINFVVPWGNMISYYYRPDSNGGQSPFSEEHKTRPSEKLWRQFLDGDEEYRNSVLKFIPNVVSGPWVVKKVVGSQPALIGSKIPTSYYGSSKDGYLEICFDVAGGGKVANSICSAVATKANIVSIDLVFLLEGQKDEECPEQILSALRLHHVQLKKEALS